LRVGNYCFHPEHFTCRVCGMQLLSVRPRFRDGAFYCPNDYSEQFCHTCSACGEKISEGTVVRALDTYFHQHHFVCATCKQPFKDGKYYEHEGKPYCAEHYSLMQLEICDACGKPIPISALTRLSNKNYHANCLQCCHCGESLMAKGSIFNKNGQIYCRKDYLNLFSRICSACGDHIIKQALSVNGEAYHPECLRCAVCHVKLEQYIAHNGYLFCSEHTNYPMPRVVCTVCKYPITENVQFAVGMKLHQHCLKCSFCSAPLEKSTARLKNEKLACYACVAKQDNPKSSPVAGAQGQSVSPSSSAPANPASAPGGIQVTVNSPLGGEGHLSKLEGSQAIHGPSYDSAVGSGQTRQPSTPSLTKGIDSKSSQSGDAKSPESSRSAAHLGSPKQSDNAHTSASTSASADVRQTETKEAQAPSPRPRAPKQCTIEWKRGELIGRGSFGKVYLGMNLANGELLAIKQVELNTTEQEETARQIETEISLMEDLRHPNIVSLLGTQRTGNKLNIIMEYVAGKSLDTILERFGPLHENVMVNYAHQLLEALAYCHAHGVVHRDIKGKNVLVDPMGQLKLADFGSAKRFEDVLRKDAPSLGYNYTPLWTAPEVLIGDYNSKVDIWSLGCVVIEMATAKAPWAEQNFEHPFRALYHIANENSIPKIPSRLSPNAKDFLLKCLCRNPDERPTAAELLKHPWFDQLRNNSNAPRSFATPDSSSDNADDQGGSGAGANGTSQ